MNCGTQRWKMKYKKKPKKKIKPAMVFKIQRPIICSGQYEVLCYNRNRSIIGQFPPSKELLDMFEEDEYKIYVNGTFDEKTGNIIIKDKIPTEIVVGAEMEF